MQYLNKNFISLFKAATQAHKFFSACILNVILVDVTFYKVSNLSEN